jgi:hypothetical protein
MTPETRIGGNQVDDVLGSGLDLQDSSAHRIHPSGTLRARSGRARRAERPAADGPQLGSRASGRLRLLRHRPAARSASESQRRVGATELPAAAHHAQRARLRPAPGRATGAAYPAAVPRGHSKEGRGGGKRGNSVGGKRRREAAGWEWRRGGAGCGGGGGSRSGAGMRLAGRF